MNVVVAIEHHFLDVNGEIYTELAFGYDYWLEYLQSFDEVLVLARVGKADTVPEGWFRADGPSVSFIKVHDYLGPKQFLLNIHKVLMAAFRAFQRGDSFILRSGNICTSLWIWLFLTGTRYAREVQGKIGESMQRNLSARYPRSTRLFAAISEWVAKLQVRKAFVASYVSEDCRKNYPTGNGNEFVFSSVRLNSELITAPRSEEELHQGSLRIVSVGRMEAEKGHSVLLKALKVLKDEGVPFQARLIGPGSLLEDYRSYTREQGLEDAVEVVGGVEYGPKLFAHLDWGQVFVIPSLSEGMPRALIEAMARGLPAVGTQVGGIPEVLDASALVPAGDPEALASALRNRIADRTILVTDSERNFNFAVTNYSAERMQSRKLEFWRLAASAGKGAS